MSQWLGFGGGNNLVDCWGVLYRWSLVSLLLVVIMLTSREGGAFVLDDFLKYIVHNCFGVVRVGLLGHAQNVATLLDVILDVVVAALVSELSHLDLLSRELLVEVEEIQAGRR